VERWTNGLTFPATQSLSSKASTVAKAQQAPHDPWYLTAPTHDGHLVLASKLENAVLDWSKRPETEGVPMVTVLAWTSADGLIRPLSSFGGFLESLFLRVPKVMFAKSVGMAACQVRCSW